MFLEQRYVNLTYLQICFIAHRHCQDHCRKERLSDRRSQAAKRISFLFCAYIYVSSIAHNNMNARKDEEPKDKATTPAKPKKTALPSVKNGKASPANKVVGNKVLRGKTRGAAVDNLQEEQAKLAAHQKILHQQRQQEGLARWAGEEGDLTGKEGKTWKKYQSYKGEGALPPVVQNMKVNYILYI